MGMSVAGVGCPPIFPPLHKTKAPSPQRGEGVGVRGHHKGELTIAERIEEHSGPESNERAFERLPRRTQIRLLRQLAGVALAAYDLPPARVTLLAHLFNTTFRVDTATEERYVLRIP